MAYTETTNTSYGQRLSGSMKGIVSGLLMFIIGTCLLWWNEGRAVKTSKAIKEAESVAVHVDDVSTVDASLNGKLIHASAFADTKDTLADDIFGVRTLAIKLNRKVEYYQWIENSKSETRDKIGGGQETVTTYTYESKWVDKPVKSSEFKDPEYKNLNFVLTTIEEKDQLADNVTFGAYTLPEFIKRSISGNVPADVQMTNEQVREWNKALHTSVSVRDSVSLVHSDKNTVYFGQSPNSPRVGDVRITFYKVMPADISLIAKVNGETFEDYKTQNGESFSRVEMGTVSADNMFQNAQDENNMLTWILRIVGLLLVVFGVLPFLGNIVDAGVGLVCWIFGLAWSLIVIAIAWLVYRPVIGILLLVAAVAGIIFLKSRSKKTVPQS